MAKNEQTDPQQTQLDRIEKRLYRLSSIRWTFLLSVVRGVGTAIGATVIASILFYFGFQILEEIEFVDIDVIQDIFGANSENQVTVD